jgi:acyl-coenzyme A thioesterase PaaI-like protein
MTVATFAVPAAANAEATVLKQWGSFRRLPFGRRLFNLLIGITVPYAGSIAPEVVDLMPGHARARMADRRRVRNHLRSLHAVALTNLAELTGNLALMSRQPPQGTRWIVTGFRTEFLKKARGTITADCILPELDWSATQDLDARVELRDGAGDLVMIAHPLWRIGPDRSKQA